MNKNLPFSTTSEEKLSQIFDLPSSELSLFKITVYAKEDMLVVMPEKNSKILLNNLKFYSDQNKIDRFSCRFLFVIVFCLYINKILFFHSIHTV